MKNGSKHTVVLILVELLTITV